MNNVTDINDDELLYRKVSVNSRWYDSERNELKPDALNPRDTDTTGISLDRARSTVNPRFRSVEKAAKGPSPNGYYVAVFRVGDLRSHGISVVADPQPDNPGHTIIQDLTYSNRKDPASQELKVLLAHKLVLRVEGPFHTDPN